VAGCRQAAVPTPLASKHQALLSTTPPHTHTHTLTRPLMQADAAARAGDFRQAEQCYKELLTNLQVGA
jgi:hypothetical protein